MRTLCKCPQKTGRFPSRRPRRNEPKAEMLRGKEKKEDVHSSRAVARGVSASRRNFSTGDSPLFPSPLPLRSIHSSGKLAAR